MARTRQPRGQVRINPYWVSRGLVAAKNFQGDVRDSLLSQFGTLDSGVHLGGTGLLFDGASAGAQFGACPKIEGISKFTVVSVATLATLTGNRKSLFSYGSLSTSDYWVNAHWSSGEIFLYWGTTDIYYIGGTPFYDVGKESVYGLSFDGGATTKFDAYKNGALHSSFNLSVGSPTVTPTPSSKIFRVGGDEQGDSYRNSWRGNIAAQFLFADKLSSAELVELTENPWQLYVQPKQIWIQLGVAASGDTSLIIPDISQTQSLDSLLLTTQSAIVIQDTAQTHALENIVLSTAASTNLIVNDTSQTHTVDAPLLTSASLLGLADTSQSHTLDNTILTSNTGVVVADTSQGHTTENLALDSGLILTVNDVNQSHTVDAQTMVTTSILQIADVAHGQQTDSIDLNAQWFITINDSNHSHTVEVPTLTLPGTGTGATVDEIADEIMLRLNATTIPVDVQKINSVEVFGTGTNIDPWR